MKRVVAVVGFTVLVVLASAQGSAPVHADERPRLLVEARDAVIAGDLAAARTAGAALAWEIDRKGRARYHQDDAPIVAAATRVADSTNLDAAARGVADVVVACAACHEARGGLVVPEPELPPEGDALRVEMERHAGAMDELWAGLVTPSRPALQTAAELFASSTLAPPGPLREHARAADERVNRAAKVLAKVPEGEERAAAFADLMLACAACHVARPDGVSIEPE